MSLSNRAYAWLAAMMIGAVIVLALVLSHLQDIAAAWLWIRWILALIAIILAVYGLYLLWDRVHTRHLARNHQAQEIKLLVAGYEDEKWRAEQTLLHAQQMDQARIDLEREKVRLDQMRAHLEHERLMVTIQWQAQHATIAPGHTIVIRDESGYTTLQAPQVAGLLGAGKKQQEEEDEIVIPQAPRFLDMVHLLSDKKSPLCFNLSGPVYGTVDDLLSMAVTGKPGRGKTTALMYYVAILLKAGAEVWVWDPHGAMAELAQLNGKQLSLMPATAKVVYLDRKPDIVASIPPLLQELEIRDELYRPAHEVKHPLLLLADELPVLADWDDELKAEFKARPQHMRLEDGEYLAPSLITVIRRMVLEARKWKCFFIGSGQSFDAQILPTRVTENFNSRIVFFSSDRRARMSGLENDAIKNLLPAIRRAGSGVMVFDCSRFDEAIIGALPYIAVEDLIAFLGAANGNVTGVLPMPDLEPSQILLQESPQSHQEAKLRLIKGPIEGDTGVPDDGLKEPVDTLGDTPELGPDDLMLSDLQIKLFSSFYQDCGNIEISLSRIKNDKGQGLGKRYYKHASWIVKRNGLRKGA